MSGLEFPMSKMNSCHTRFWLMKNLYSSCVRSINFVCLSEFCLHFIFTTVRDGSIFHPLYFTPSISINGSNNIRCYSYFFADTFCFLFPIRRIRNIILKLVIFKLKHLMRSLISVCLPSVFYPLNCCICLLCNFFVRILFWNLFNRLFWSWIDQSNVLTSALHYTLYEIHFYCYVSVYTTALTSLAAWNLDPE